MKNFGPKHEAPKDNGSEKPEKADLPDDTTRDAPEGVYKRVYVRSVVV